MTPEQAQEFHKWFYRWFKGNELAVRACMDLLEVAHLWDDIEDKDKDILSAAPMRKAIIDLPSNPFWAAHQSTLLPILQSVFLQWKAANFLEKSDMQDDKNKAYMLRASLYQVFHMVAAICGGIDWAEQIGHEVYRLYGEKLELKEAADA